MKNDIIVGLDIGSSQIKLIIAQKKLEYSEEKLHIIGAVSHPSAGVGKNGTINSIEDAVSALSACLEKAERLVGVPIDSVYLAYNHAKTQYERVKGVAIVSKNDGEIDQDDIDRAIESARSFPVSNNYEIFKTIPVKYNIDNNEDVKDPIGMRGIRLEVEVIVSLVLSSQINNLVKIVQRVGLDVEDILPSAVNMAELFLSHKEKELGAAVLDIGSTTTSLAVFEDGVLLHFNVLPIGSEYITADIGLGLRCPITLAERIKLEFGQADSSDVDSSEEIDISHLLKEEKIDDENSIISRHHLSEIIEARVEEIFNLVDEDLKKINRSKILPVGIFLAGGGSLLDGIVKVAKRTLSLPVAFLEPREVRVEVDKAARPEFLSALGLVVFGSYVGGSSYRGTALKDGVKNAFKKASNLFKKIIPK